MSSFLLICLINKLGLLREYEATLKRDSAPKSREAEDDGDNRWSPPVTGHYKVNTDRMRRQCDGIGDVMLSAGISHM